MAVAFANNWDIILSKLESLFRTEFKGALKVYSGLQNEMEGNQYLRLSPISSSLVDYSINLETREFSIGMALYFNEPNIKKTGIDNVMRLVSRIETIIANNNSITLPDGSVAYDCKIESSEIEASDSEYLVQFNFKCTHANSISFPAVTIKAAEVADGGSSTDSTLSLTFKTSHTTTNFVVGDISVSNGSLSSFTGSGTNYTATFTPASGGATTIQVAADKFTDYSGNKNVVSDVFNWTYVEKFVSTWTLSGADTVTLPLISSGTYNFDIDWGDGTTSTITAYNQVLSDESVAVTHSYTGGGVKTISIGGTNSTITGWQFNNAGDKTLITGISNWGTLNISTNAAFHGCTALNVTATNAPTISSTDLNNTFNNCTALTSAGGTWDTSSVESINSIFHSATNFNGDITGWDVSSVTAMYLAMYGSSSFNQDISGWDVSNVTIFAGLFQGCSDFNQPIGDWGSKTSNVTNMSDMFRGCTDFNQSLSTWNTGKVTDMNSMLRDVPTFNQDISDWDVDQVTNFGDFLNGNTALSTANYNKLLHYWEADDPTNSLAFHGGDATTDSSSGGVDGTAARARLVLATGSGGDGWTITDGD